MILWPSKESTDRSRKRGSLTFKRKGPRECRICTREGKFTLCANMAALHAHMQKEHGTR